MFIIVVFVLVFLHQLDDTLSITHDFMKKYKIFYPYQMRQFVDLYNIPDCQCPRVYWPVCGNDNITYINHCILFCHKDMGMRRYGPCVEYRRNMASQVDVVLPKTWEDAGNDTGSDMIVNPKDFIKVTLPACQNENCTEFGS